ncbi:MAG: hypothetical protein IJS15_00655, partial [Victivallales bacterium]|nr:hypothetical protein [Victivallales bacterium]
KARFYGRYEILHASAYINPRLAKDVEFGPFLEYCCEWAVLIVRLEVAWSMNLFVLMLSFLTIRKKRRQSSMAPWNKTFYG